MSLEIEYGESGENNAAFVENNSIEDDDDVPGNEESELIENRESINKNKTSRMVIDMDKQPKADKQACKEHGKKTETITIRKVVLICAVVSTCLAVIQLLITIALLDSIINIRDPRTSLESENQAGLNVSEIGWRQEVRSKIRGLEANAKFSDKLLLHIYDGIQLQLVDGSSSQEGRLEILFLGEWGRICDDIWDYKDATVACRQLGFSSGKPLSNIKQGSSKIWIHQVKCNGDEVGIQFCDFSRWGTSKCENDRDVGVVCT